MSAAGERRTDSCGADGIGLAGTRPFEQRVGVLLREDGRVRVGAQRACQDWQRISHRHQQILVRVLLQGPVVCYLSLTSPQGLLRRHKNAQLPLP